MTEFQKDIVFYGLVYPLIDLDNLKLGFNLEDDINDLKVGEMITKYVHNNTKAYYRFEITELENDYFINKQFISEGDESKVKLYLTTN